MLIRKPTPRKLGLDEPILQRDSHKRPVTRRDFVAQGFQVARYRQVLVQNRLEALLKFGPGVEVDGTVVAVNNQFAILQPGIGQVDCTHHGGYAHGPCQK